MRSHALKAKKESNGEESSASRNKGEEYVMAVRDFKKFFKRKGRFVRQLRDEKKSFQRSRDDKNGKSERKCFRCGHPNHLIVECPKPPRGKNQRALVGGSWSGSDEEDEKKVKDETCLMAQACNKICLGTDLEPNEWIKDSACTKHMKGNRKLFSSYKAYNRGYSQNSKAYIIINKHTMKVEESLNVTFDENPPPSKTSLLVDDDLVEEEAIEVSSKKNIGNDIEDETLEINEIVNIKESKNHASDNLI
ncbi:zf-CCHC domain-containing protein [Tanacetum coccineum]